MGSKNLSRLERRMRAEVGGPGGNHCLGQGQREGLG